MLAHDRLARLEEAAANLDHGERITYCERGVAAPPGETLGLSCVFAAFMAAATGDDGEFVVPPIAVIERDRVRVSGWVLTRP